MTKVIHSMIRVLNVERSKEFYEKAFNLKEKRYLDFDDFALVYLDNDENDFEIELTLNKDQKVVYTHGNGYDHIVVCVDDLDAALLLLKIKVCCISSAD